MTSSSVEARQQHALIDNARTRLVMTEEELWVTSFGCGANLKRSELTDFLRGLRGVSDHDFDALAVALNEAFTTSGLGQPVPYSEDLTGIYGDQRCEPRL